MKDIPMFVRCRARDSGGVRCEAYLTEIDEEHNHFISQSTIDYYVNGGPVPAYMETDEYWSLNA